MMAELRTHLQLGKYLPNNLKFNFFFYFRYRNLKYIFCLFKYEEQFSTILNNTQKWKQCW